MYLNDLLRAKDIDVKRVLVLRHRPSERSLNRVLPLLAEERPDVFNTYQQFQGEKLENAMRLGGYVASFVGREAGKALFIGLYSIGEPESFSRERYWNVPGNVELKKHGMKGFTSEDPRSSILKFDLQLMDFYASWKGKLVVGWPPPERSWWRRAHRNEMPVLAILKESELVEPMPTWRTSISAGKNLRTSPRAGRMRFASGGPSITFSTPLCRKGMWDPPVVWIICSADGETTRVQATVGTSSYETVIR